MIALRNIYLILNVSGGGGVIFLKYIFNICYFYITLLKLL